MRLCSGPPTLRLAAHLVGVIVEQVFREVRRLKVVDLRQARAPEEDLGKLLLVATLEGKGNVHRHLGHARSKHLQGLAREVRELVQVNVDLKVVFAAKEFVLRPREHRLCRKPRRVKKSVMGQAGDAEVCNGWVQWVRRGG